MTVSTLVVLRPDGTPLPGLRVLAVGGGDEGAVRPLVTGANGRVDLPVPAGARWQVTAVDDELLAPDVADDPVPPEALPPAGRVLPPDPGAHVTVPPAVTVTVVARRAVHVTCPGCRVDYRVVEPLPGAPPLLCPHDDWGLSAISRAVVDDPGSFTAPKTGQDPAATPSGLRARGRVDRMLRHGTVPVFWDESRFLIPAGDTVRLWGDTPRGPLSVRVVGRKAWGAKPPRIDAVRAWEFHEAAVGASPPYANRGIPRSEHRPLADVLLWMAIHHTTDSAPASAAVPRALQDKHQGDVKSDIAYHFVVDGDGAVYEGRPLGIEGDHVEKFNAGHIGVVLAGDFHGRMENLWQVDTPTSAQLDSLDDLVEVLAARFEVSSVDSHRQRKLQSVPAGKGTDCPGDVIIPHVHRVLRRRYPGPPP